MQQQARQQAEEELQGEDKNLFPGFFFREESVIFACKKTNKV